MNYKQNNDKILLDFIRENTGCRRFHIQDKVGLSKAATAKIVNRLIEGGFIAESDPDLQKREKGKPYKILNINPTKAYFMGISARLWNITICIMDFGLNIIWEKEIQLPKIFDANYYQQQYNNLIKEAKCYIPNRQHIDYISLSLPATTTNKGTIVDFAYFENELEQVDFHSILVESFDDPAIWIIHHSIALSFFATVRNKKTSKNIFIFNVDYGIGGALIVKGKSYLGAHSYAGNIGAFFPYKNPRPSVVDLAKYLNTDVNELSVDKIEALFRQKNSKLMQWIEQQGTELSMPLSAVVELFDPKKIILGGLFPRLVLKEMRKFISLDYLEAPERVSKRKAKIKIATEVGQKVYAYGAARYALKKYINREVV